MLQCNMVRRFGQPTQTQVRRFGASQPQAPKTVRTQQSTADIQLTEQQQRTQRTQEAVRLIEKQKAQLTAEVQRLKAKQDMFREQGDGETVRDMQKKIDDQKQVNTMIFYNFDKIGAMVASGKYNPQDLIGYAIQGAQGRLGQIERTKTARAEQAIAKQEQIQKAEQQGLKPVYSKGKLVGFEDTQRQQSIGLQEAGVIGKERLERAGYEVTTRQQTPQEMQKQQEQLKVNQQIKETARVTSEFEKRIGMKKTPFEQNVLNINPVLQSNEPFLTVEAVPKEEKTLSNLYGLPSMISRKEDELLTERGRGDKSMISSAKLTGLGLIAPLVDFGVTVINPIETGKSLLTASKTPIQTFTDVKKQISKKAELNPIGFSGNIVGESLLFKGILEAPRSATKISDIVRTRGLTEIPKTEVIAPEFFKGQKFPAIKKGQTAGDLLGEFKPMFPGETKPGGFTATPKPFKKDTSALRGTSELPGLYQSPLISPHFLRVTEGERKLVSLNIFDTLRPTAVRVTPTSFELVPDVTKSQKMISGRIGEIKSFFETAEKGKSYIPFIKTEKEAVIPFGTQLKQTGKVGYFKFEERRIPIFEFETIGEVTKEGKKIKKKKLVTIEDISDISSKGKIRSKGVITPLDSSSIGRLGSSGSPSISSLKITSPSFPKSSGSISKPSKPSKISSPSSKSISSPISKISSPSPSISTPRPSIIKSQNNFKTP